jgi:fibronectin type 3 domain-containing protein
MATAVLSKEDVAALGASSPVLARDLAAVMENEAAATSAAAEATAVGEQEEDEDAVIQLEPVQLDSEALLLPTGSAAAEPELHAANASSAEEQARVAQEARAAEIRRKFAARGARENPPAPAPGPEPEPEPEP